ncbi:MAG: DUF262 domain-containing protein, partial [Proteobacteria bacterium]|nr:DUF262 domain-containing protein [Pseudomonadota bacterium]
DRISIITKLQDNPNTVRPENFSRSGFNYLIDCFEIYKKIITEKNKLDLNFPMWRHNPKTSIISEIVFEDNIFSQINSASYTQKVLFYAQTEYLLKANEFNFDQFQNWMRVIRNIVSRGNIEKSGKRPDIIRSPQTFDGVINLISELSKGCENIYDYLSSKGKRTSSFAKDQVDEEIIKAKLITNDINNKQVIFETEDNDLLMGRIDFVLHCIDFDYDKIETFDLEKFKKIQKAISKNFQKDSDVSNELRRALLTIDVNGEYEYYGYWWSFWNVVSAHKRCLIENLRELEYYVYSPYKDYFKKLLIKLIDNNLREIIIDFNLPVDMPNWKKRLIREDDLLDKKSKSNYIAIPEDNSCCYLLKSKRPRDLDGCEKID